MSTKLTDHILLRLGFRGEGKDILNEPAYRLKIPYNSKIFKDGYLYQIQVVLKPELPDTNGNSGIVSLYDPGVKDAHCHVWEKDDGSKSKKIDKILWYGDGQRGGYKYISFPPRCIPIAWGVTTIEKLNAIYTSLTGNPPLTLRPEIKSPKKK